MNMCFTARPLRLNPVSASRFTPPLMGMATATSIGHVPHSQFTQIQGKGRNNADGIDIEPPFNGMFYSARPFPNYKDVDISDIGPLSLTLFVAASLCPFDYDGADTKKNYPWLTYMEGEVCFPCCMRIRG